MKDSPPPTSEFSLHYWLDGYEYESVPKRVDRYRPGHISWGSDPKRGRAIQSRRLKKRDDANLEFFMASVYPSISHLLPSETHFEIAKATGNREALRLSGFRLWKKGERQQWIKRGDPIEEQAASLGAGIVPDAEVDRTHIIKHIP